MRIGWSFLVATVIKFCYDRRVFLLPLPFLFIVHEKLVRSFFCYKHQRFLVHSSMIFAGAGDEAFLLETAPQMHPGFLLHLASFFATVGILVCWNQLTVGYDREASGKMLQPCLHFATADNEKCYNRQILFAGTSQSLELHPWRARAARAGSIHGERRGRRSCIHGKRGRRSCIQGVRDTLRCKGRAASGERPRRAAAAPATRTAGEGANRRQGRNGGSSSLVAGG